MKWKSVYTQAVHAGRERPVPDFSPVTAPVYLSVAYMYEDVNDLEAVFDGKKAGYVYRRHGNPTVRAFEEAVATLAEGEDAVAFSSGMAAMHATLLGAGVKRGSAIVSAGDVYGATYALQRDVLASLGVRTRFVDATDLGQVAKVLDEERPMALVCETISNPLLKVADVPALTRLAHKVGAQLIVDNTFASPYLFCPLGEGVDYAVHSATKYLAGHGDVMAGVVVCSEERAKDLRERQKMLGANLGPEQAWLALRGMRTLALRMRQQCVSAQTVAEWLSGCAAVADVNYPGLPNHPQHSVAERLFQGKGFGGMISFDIRGAHQPEVFRFMEALKLILPATTLGDVYTLVLYPAHSSHRALSPEERRQLGIGDGLVRLSVGIEEVGEIIADLGQALSFTV
ncbi:MAG: PLP-dependent aspartate aminotransferase family protein [Anaerolineae bacterium]